MFRLSVCIRGGKTLLPKGLNSYCEVGSRGASVQITARVVHYLLGVLCVLLYVIYKCGRGPKNKLAVRWLDTHGL